MHRYPVADLFESIQGEGFWTGVQAVFLRLAGCPIKCKWCDTDYTAREVLTADEIVERLSQSPLRRLVITGGEPLQFDLTPIVAPLLESHKFEMTEIETSGALPLKLQVKQWHRIWITVSPKPAADYKIEFTTLYRARALKFVVTEDFDPAIIFSLPAAQNLPVFLQPCDYKEPERNSRSLKRTLELLKLNPSWRLSLQVHKILELP